MSFLQNWNEVEETSTGAVKKRKLDGQGAELVRVEIAAGTKADRHSHPHEQFVQVIAGRGTLETTEGRRAFSAGSVFHFPAETWHEAIFDEETILVETNFRV